MPNFELVAKSEAELKSMTGRRAEITREYLGYIEQLTERQAGKLIASGGESAATVRRHLGQAAKLAGRKLVVRRNGDEIYFWLGEGLGTRGRRSRSKKAK